ncbi:reticulon-4 receptor-like [Clavelina lepadiformis]|uniref:reticulon-4 receptor-like n=1 Tax=Clavelina lepadiformis TaxID=159417 RepID=UPI00404100A0
MNLEPFIKILLYFLTLATTSSPCPSECSCQKKSTDCSDKNLALVPTGISSATKRLLLDNNTLSRISHNAFVKLSNLVELQLSTNKLNSLDGFLFSNLVLLELFNVCSNALTNVSQNALDQLTGLIVSLSFLIFN